MACGNMYVLDAVRFVRLVRKMNQSTNEKVLYKGKVEREAGGRGRRTSTSRGAS